MRTLLSDVMAQAGEAADVPAISAQVRRVRKRLQDQWDVEHPDERGNPFTIEAVATRVPMSAKAYGDVVTLDLGNEGDVLLVDWLGCDPDELPRQLRRGAE